MIRWRRMRESDGYALVDLLAAIAIIAILATAAVPAINRFMANTKLNIASRSLVSEIRYGQQAAIAQNEPWRMHFAPYGFRLLKASTPQRPLVELPAGITYGKAIPLNGTGEITFAATGTIHAHADLYSIPLVNQYGQRRTVVIHAITGRVRIE